MREFAGRRAPPARELGLRAFFDACPKTASGRQWAALILSVMLPSRDICRSAHMARDRRFDGRFVVAVLSTGVFCRPICPAPTPRPENARYFAAPAAALAEGYRPCRRCRPETAPTAPEWSRGSDIVLRALRLVEDGFLDERRTSDLATAVGVGSRHLTRLFGAEVGVGPSAFARARRLLLAVRLLDETDLTISTVAMSAGYRSLRRFNAEFRATFGTPPSARRRAGAKAPPQAPLMLRQTFRTPYHAGWMFSFLQRRAIPCLESVTRHCYRRRIGADGWLEAKLDGLATSALRVSIPALAVGTAADFLARLRRLFDLDADPAAIDAHLATEHTLAPLVRAAPGLRVPGTWDAFEGAVRASRSACNAPRCWLRRCANASPTAPSQRPLPWRMPTWPPSACPARAGSPYRPSRSERSAKAKATAG